MTETGDYIFGKDCHEELDDTADLAFVGSAIDAETDCDARTNKVGGRPVLFAAQPAPRCPGCGATLALVLQAHLPLAAPPDDRRQLLVCVCTSPRCRLPPARRFAAFRVRIPCATPPPPSPSTSSPAAAPAPAPAPALFAECNTWGDDDDENWGASDDVNTKEEPVDAPSSTEQPTTEATTTETEPEPPAVFGEAAEHPFAAHYLETDYEPDALTEDDAHERALLARYKAREAEAAKEEEKEGKKGKEKEEADVYEHAAGDRAFRRFQRRVQRAPTQALRWCYGGRPLQLCDATPLARVCVPRCPRCGARRVFEAQLMPALLDALAPTAAVTAAAPGAPGGPALPYEFGSVLVCSCGADCDTHGELAPEHVVWQPCL